MSVANPAKISLALGGSKKPAGLSNGLKRSRAALQDHVEEEQDHPKAQRVSHFDHSAGGAIDDSKPRGDHGPLVIALQANRDWKEASVRNRRQKAALPREAPDGDQEAELAAREEAKKPIFGLNVSKRRTGEETTEEVNGHATAEEPESAGDQAAQGSAEVTPRQRTDDELAMDALLGKSTQPDLVLPAMTEEEAFERDYHEAPDMATLDDYARVPVEQFGAALLRGMGWKDGEGIGSNRGQKLTKTKIPERRPALLGIGAKEEAAVAQELGTWGKAAKDKKGPQQVYNPVLLRDKQTGELYTEEELQKKKERDEREKYEQEFDEKEKRREKDRCPREDSRERDSGRRDKERRSERRDGRERDGDRDRHRNRRDDSDEEYYRRKKEKERKHRDRERDHRDYQDRSGRSSNSRERHRDRDRRR